MPDTLAVPDVISSRMHADLSACAWRSRSDEQLVALVRRGQQRAFDTLAARYQSRLLRFCRRMLRSQEDAEDVLQEVFTSAFNAILVDGREINVRPWLYRIATNRCINQLRRCTPVTVASLDDRCAANERTAFDELVSRQEFRDLVGDVQALPARQRTALLLCEIDGLSYQHIAVAMTTTVPAVKSLMVRARFGLLDAAAARGPQPVVPGRRRSALCNVAPQPSSVTVSGRRELAVAA